MHLPRPPRTITRHDDSRTIEYWERYATLHPEGPDINPGVARPTIDHGRLLTLTRREKLSTLTVLVESQHASIRVTLPNRALLSPRRIVRAVWEDNPELNVIGPDRDPLGVHRRARGHYAADMADAIFEMIRLWRDLGYPSLTDPWAPRIGERIHGWHLTLTQKQN